MKRRTTCILFCALSALAETCAAAQGPQVPAKEATLQARPLQAEENTPQVPNEAALRDQLARNPQSPEVLYQLALVLRLKGQYRESLETYTRAAHLKKPGAMQLRSVALNYVQLNDYDDAIRWLRVAADMEPKDTDVLYSLGRCLYTQNLFAEAETAFINVLNIDPGHLKAQENLGLVYDAQNKPEMAEKALRTAARWADERNIPDSWPYLDLGNLLLDQSRAKEAMPFLEKAAELAPNSAQCHEKFGHALRSTGDPNRAIRELETAIKLDPKDAKAHLELGRAYRDAGQEDKSRAEFEKSKSLYGTQDHN
jgi:tetratricopeptide (TPR) repeat protein